MRSQAYAYAASATKDAMVTAMNRMSAIRGRSFRLAPEGSGHVAAEALFGGIDAHAVAGV